MRRTVSISVEEEFVPFVQAQVAVLRSRFEVAGVGTLRLQDLAPQPRAELTNVLHHRRWYWAVEYGGEQAIVKHTAGMPYLATLLCRPGTETAAVDLLRSGIRTPLHMADATREGLRDGRIRVSDPVLDGEAKRQIQANVRKLQEEADEAAATGDGVLAEQRRQEIEEIEDQWAKAVGKGRRDRRLGDEAEKLVNTVVQGIRRAIKAITEEHAALGAHLRAHVHTGAYCSYAPAEQTRWDIKP